MQELTIHEVARMFGKKLEVISQRSHCPIRKHKRADKSFKVFQSSEGGLLWKCFSCSPPEDAGDAVKLYSLLCGVDRKTAWIELRDRGFAVPGADRPSSFPNVARLPLRKAVVPIEGSQVEQQKTILSLTAKRWEELQSQRLGAVERFAVARGISSEFLRAHDVVDMAHDAVGFGYRDPTTGVPCRVKARALDRKSFWIEPRARQGETGVALSPLYLGDRIETPRCLQAVVVITEGEVDALTLRSLGIRNVVSLPDGSGSAGKVCLKPLWFQASLILSAVDSDAEGDRAHRDIYSRCVTMQKHVARVTWKDGTSTFKDANDALMAGWSRADFVACMQQAANELRGYEVNLASAC
jgi:hypothetical protein